MEQERINSEDDDDVEINGWPLGLPPVNARLSAASASSNLMLPSCSASSTSSLISSSDSDSESTTSFFPEKSTTLGSLIGIHSSSQLALVQDHSSEERHIGRSARHRMLCSFLSCGGRLQEDSLEASPSLSHYWGMERKETTQTTHSSMREDVEARERDLEDDIEVHAVHNNVYCPDESWTHSHSCGRSLRLILQQPSPMSPWSHFNNLSHHQSMRGDHGPTGSRLHSFWLGFCGKLSSSLAT